MRTNRFPLLCELHAHTRWSDGRLSVRELVELYAQHRFDVLCVTDHVVRDDSMLTAATFPAYLAELRREARRALDRYDLLLIAGAELTWDDADSAESAHAVAVGLDRFVGLDDGLEAAIVEARERGAAVIAAHPHGVETDANARRITRRWWLDRRLRELAHRFELVNRDQAFAWVAAEGLPSVANGDFHGPEHLATWKTQVPAARTGAEVVDYLRSSAPTPIVRFRADHPPARAVSDTELRTVVPAVASGLTRRPAVSF